MRRPALRFAILASTLIPLGLLVGAATRPQLTTANAVYTVEQAHRGGEIYARSCAMCHGADLAGTYEISPLKGRFLANWNHAPVGRLYDYVSRAMPQMAPGSLSPDQNVAVVAYLLQQNGMPAGPKPLPHDGKALDAITIERAQH